MKKILFAIAFPLLAGCGSSSVAQTAATFAIAGAVDSQIEAGKTHARVLYLPPPDVELVADDAPSEPKGRPFQREAARNLLGAVQIDDCRLQGLPDGYGHGRVVFGQDGRVTTVAIDAPGGLEPRAITCIANKLASVEVPEFSGQPEVVGAQWENH